MTNSMWPLVTNALRDAGARVEHVVSFIPQEIRGIYKIRYFNAGFTSILCDMKYHETYLFLHNLMCFPCVLCNCVMPL